MTGKPEPGRGPTKRSGATETPRQALERAVGHARAAASESLSALQALLDAACLATRGEPARAAGPLAALAERLDAWAASLAGPSEAGAAALLDAVADALEAEVSRWERRAENDSDARSVLRALLALREILWELGVRRSEPDRPAPARPAPRRRPARASRPRRVQRVPLGD